MGNLLKNFHYYLVCLPEAEGVYEVVAVPSGFLGSFHIQTNLTNTDILECGVDDAYKLLSEGKAVGAGCYVLDGQEGAVRPLLEALAQQRMLELIKQAGIGVLFDPVEVKPTRSLILEPALVA